MRLIYSALFYCLIPIIVLRMLLRSRIAPAYRQRMAERLGFFKGGRSGDTRPAIWVHAVSVGESLAAAPLIEDLLASYPGHRLVVTTTTPTGSERVKALFGDRVFHVYSPWDTPGAVKRFLRKTKPELLLIMETELWPNMLHYSRKAGCHIVLANARLSQRSAEGYARFASLTRGMLAQLNIVACQARADGDRFLSLGLQPSQLDVTGSIKFDLELDGELRDAAEKLRQAWGMSQRSIIVAASTHPGEDEQILAAFTRIRQSVDNCLLVIVPRHPERFDAVYQLCIDAGWSVQRRSSGIAPGPGDDIVLGDTMGELLLLLSAATVAVIGGSLVNHGGHNVLEASAWGVPVVTGPYMFNFSEISDLLVSAGAMTRLADPEELADCLTELLASPKRRREMGEAGQQVVADNRGAKKQLLELIDTQISSAT
ncbi:MAG: lipid IV(A) 3-deoxy-D-manno-octulosonic acid transferase [Proteobacteria bacterium]|nr:lipid IV(A) 3-deoxy-D-manno-octulosonic acid transferase [Pseudomonadota bacterium]